MTTQNGAGTAVTEGSNKGSIVAAATPLIAIAASWITGWVTSNIPGLQLDPTQVTAVIVATITAVLGVAIKWLHGWQRHESRVSDGVVPAVKAFQPATRARSANGSGARPKAGSRTAKETKRRASTRA